MKYYYTQTTIDGLFKEYATHEGFIAWTIPGSLVDGYILTANGCKTTIIKEIYLNEWSSGYALRMYKKIPRKYEKIIEMIEDAESEEDIQNYIKAFYA